MPTITIERLTKAQRLTDEQITQALRRAYYLGQTYWQQADSEFTSEHRKADATSAKFNALIAETIAAAGDKPPAAVPPIDDMDAVAIKYAHKMALDLECILAEYGGSWYNTAMQTLGEYRSAMNAIHERESPTFMGEPVIAAAGDKP